MVDYKIAAYKECDCNVFYRIGEKWGEFSNMHPDFPLLWAGKTWKSSEALYQACRFPLFLNVQNAICSASDGFEAKAISRQHQHYSRPDWEQVRVQIMYWCLQLKFSQHAARLIPLLKIAAQNCVVEKSDKDDFWGTLACGDNQLKGINVLGKLLNYLHNQLIINEKHLLEIEPPLIKDFILI